MSVSRRTLLQVLPTAAALSVEAQEVAPAANADADLEAARGSQRATAQAVRRVALPQGTEPAFRFIPRS